MPRRDGTGPDGKGPGTGRGLGPCKIKKAPKESYPIRRQQRQRKRQGQSK
jgi:hypothetical protein